MARRFTLQPADETFFQLAPSREATTFEIPRPAAEVWAELTRDNTLDWCRMLTGATWTSPRPFGVGTTRTIGVAGGALRIDEQFFRWEEGRRKSFFVTSASLPVFKRFAEDYLVEETGPAACRFTWVVASQPSAAGRPGSPLNKLVTRSLFADTRKHFGIR
jgi:hypothetical protein